MRRLTTGPRLALRVAVLSAALAARAPAHAQTGAPDEDWASSPEAYFLTREEKSQWEALPSRDARGEFQERYWVKRDPSQGTPRNEFREAILARIQTADKRFTIEKRKGSRTARGMVFIVLGAPARFEESHATGAVARGMAAMGDAAPGAAFEEGTETGSIWLYDLQRTPRILEALGRPSLEIRFFLEPHKRTDEIQNPGLFKEIRETIARKSIVNPDAVPAPASARLSGAGGVAAPPPALISRVATLPLTAAVRDLLGHAAAASRSEEGRVFSSAVVWRETGEPETLAWFFLPPGSGAVQFHALVRPEAGGAEVLASSEPATASAEFSSASPGETFLRRISLPPGAYEASFALTRADGKTVASFGGPVLVPDPSAGPAVSSLLVTRGPAATAAPASPFALGKTYVPPRADGTFSRKESLWYFFEVANPEDPARVELEVRLRRGVAPVGARKPFPANLTPLGPGRYLCGYEMPLATLTPGDYRLYVVVAAGGKDRAVRSGEFRLTE